MKRIERPWRGGAWGVLGGIILSLALTGCYGNHPSTGSSSSSPTTSGAKAPEPGKTKPKEPREDRE
jgi:hypothetical protein